MPKKSRSTPPVKAAAVKAATAPRRDRVTLKDVAAACGLSHVAVSLALRQSDEIPPETRARVLAAARRLNYVPSESARQLKGGKSGRIAYVASRLAHGFVGQILAGMEQRAFETGKYLNAIHPYSTWFKVDAKETVLRQILYGAQADAVVLVSCKPTPALTAEYRRHGIPLVLIEEKVPGCHAVRVDNVLGARLATQHLIDQGCRHLGLISGIVDDDGMDLNPTVAERRRGFLAALRGAGIKLAPGAMQAAGFYDQADGRRCLDLLLKAVPGLDGVFCAAGDNVAMGVLERARELGLKVPQRLKVVGYDDMDVARLLSPALTTVRQPIQAMGAQAFDLAVAAAEGRLAGDSDVLFQPELIRRASA